jgi:hypothetical protein
MGALSEVLPVNVSQIMFEIFLYLIINTKRSAKHKCGGRAKGFIDTLLSWMGFS